MCVRVVLLALALLAGPAIQTHAQTQQAANQPIPDLPLPLLQSLTYVDIEKGRALPLSDGVYRDERRVVRLLDVVAYGDLDNDGTRDAVVLLEERTAETTIIHLAAVVQRAGRVRNMASYRLGSDVVISSVTIKDQLIELHLLTGIRDVGFPKTMFLAYRLSGSELLLMRQTPITLKSSLKD